MPATLTRQGVNIRRARRWMGYSQKELAEQLEAALGEAWDDNKVSRIEIGKQDLMGQELIALSTILGQSKDWLLGDPDAQFDDRVNPRYRNYPLGLLAHPLPELAA